MQAFSASPMHGTWVLSPNGFYTRTIPGSSSPRLYERARLECLPGGAGHGGRDIDRRGDDMVLRAVWDGTIHIYGWDDFGNHLGVVNASGEEAFYAHMAAFRVSAGQHVRGDDPVGIIGATGQVTGEHCHFELRRRATDWCSAVDPTTALLTVPSPGPSPISKEPKMILVQKQGVSTVYRYDGNHLQQLTPHQALRAQQLGAALHVLSASDDIWTLPFSR